MKDLAIYGAGGFGREIYCAIRNNNKKNPQWNLIGFFDDGKEKGSRNEYGEILGGIEEINNWSTPLCVIIAIGAPKILRKVVGMINNPLLEFPNYIDSKVSMADPESIHFGKGNILLGETCFTVNVQLGDFNILNGNVLFGHDAKVGNYNAFMNGTKICGEVSIGDCNLFGMNTIIIQQLKVGNEINFGAGSVMMTKPRSGGTYVGVPAKLLKF